MKKQSVKVPRIELEKNAREALDVLMRAHADGADSVLGHHGPVSTYVALGYARACLRIGLGMPREEIKHGC